MMADGENLFRGRLVRLAAPQPDDAEIMARWTESSVYLRLVDTDYARPKPAQAFAESEDDSHAHGNAVAFRLRTIDGDRLVGFLALHDIEWNNQVAELSIGIGDPADWDKGYGTEALQLGLRYAFDELNLYRIGLNSIAYNARAIHAYEKAGFLREGVSRGFVLRDGQRHDLLWMDILRDEWEAIRKAQ